MSDDLDLVNLLHALAQDMTFGDEATAAETCRLSADAIERLTAERDAAWEAGATWMREKVCAWAKSGGVGGNHLAAEISAISTSKPE